MVVTERHKQPEVRETAMAASAASARIASNPFQSQASVSSGTASVYNFL